MIGDIIFLRTDGKKIDGRNDNEFASLTSRSERNCAAPHFPLVFRQLSLMLTYVLVTVISNLREQTGQTDCMFDHANPTSKS